jgi:hypothetical protein
VGAVGRQVVLVDLAEEGHQLLAAGPRKLKPLVLAGNLERPLGYAALGERLPERAGIGATRLG